MQKMESYLFCNDCMEETEHVIIYLNTEISRIRCKKCGRVWGVDKIKLLELYTLDTVKSILKEPLKLSDKLKEEGSSFLFYLPKYLLTKPYSTLKEILNILDEYKE